MTTQTVEDPAALSADEDAPKPFPVVLRVRRFLPEEGPEAFWQDFTVDVFPTDRILDALHKIKWERKP